MTRSILGTPAANEGGCGPGEERSARGALLVREDLGVRHAGVVIHYGVDEVVPDPGSFPGSGRAHGATAPPSTVGDPPDLLDVHMDQLAGTGPLVPFRGRLRGADHVCGHRVALTQVGHVVTAQDPGHVRAEIPKSGPIQSCPLRDCRRAATTACSTSTDVFVGIVCGRQDRSAKPALPSAAYRSTQVLTHLRDTPIAAAIWAWRQPCWWRWTINHRP